jgi:hypothetical protein
MGRTPHKLGRWASENLRLDILHELKVLAAKNQVTMAEMVNRALWLGLMAIRKGVEVAEPIDPIEEQP